MILSQPDIRREVEAGNIKFTPALEDRQWGEASVDLRLGFSFTKFKIIPGLTISVAEGLSTVSQLDLWNTKKLNEFDSFNERETFELKPKDFVLAMTYESVTVPRNLIALVEGRSTYARLGLSMHQTAPWIQPGWSGQIILEIMNNGSVTIKLTPIIDRPCQLTFFELKTELPRELGYGSKPSDRYQNQDHPLVHKK